MIVSLAFLPWDTFLQKKEMAMLHRNSRRRSGATTVEMAVILPAVILFLLLQRRFVEGMTAGGLKV